MSLPPIAVSDTNILVSSVISRRGLEAQTVSMFREQLVRPAVSIAVLAEYELVLSRRKFGFPRADIDEVLFPFFAYGIHWELPHQLSISPHEADNRFLECAQAANADFLITGNLRHFPAMHGKTRILNARSFLDIVAR